MEYQVMALRWRPQQFDDVVGQQHVTTTLRNAIERGRVAHAYIFAGPRGTGKTSTARILAKALNCSEGPTATPCDSCPSCTAIMAGNSMDVLEIDGASNRGIDKIRELRENVKFAPGISRYKIYIIDEVHQITEHAFNALLKTLEEPPPHVKFFFATTEPHKVPATILSRCQRFDLRSLSPAEIVGRLAAVARKEKIAIDEEARFAIARYAQGSMRDAESILDQLVSFSDGKIGADDVISMLGLVRESVLFDMTDALIGGDYRRGLELIAGIAEKGKELTLFLSDWISYLRAIMLVLVLGGEENILGLSPEAWKGVVEQSGKINREQMVYVLELLTRAEQRMRWALSPRIVLELAFLKAAQVKERASLADIVQKIAALEKRLAAGGGAGCSAAVEHPAVADVPPPPRRDARSEAEGKGEGRERKAGSSVEASASVTPPAREAEGDKTFERVKGVWHEVIERVGQVRPTLKSCLIEGRLARCENGVIYVEFEPEHSFHCQTLEEGANKKIMLRVLSEKLGRQIALKCETRREEKGAGRGGRPAVRKKDINNIKKNPLIQTALEIFNAQVIEIKK